MEPSKADLLPSFREAFATPEAIDDEGAKALATAIIVRAAQDYYDACDQIGLKDIEDVLWTYDGKLRVSLLGDRSEIELFVYSDLEWYEMLTTIDRKVFLDKIRKHKMSEHLPAVKGQKKGDIVPPRNEAELLNSLASKRTKKDRVAIAFHTHEYI